MVKVFDAICLPTVEIIENNGYTYEIHHVITEDGYILELHRIPSSKSGQESFRNYPVFIHHGLLGSSADWVLGGAEISLPLQLADVGYDTWLANCRGNIYSRKHKELTPKQKAFWNFSLNEIGKYDLPAAIDYILKKTKAPQVHYIGYSMGTTVFYIMCSERPKYQSKIRSQVSLAPVANLCNTTSLLKYFAKEAHTINISAQIFFHGMICNKTWAESPGLSKDLIYEKSLIFAICGSDPKFFNSDLIPHILGHMPTGTASKLVEHFAQFILNDTFAQYDYRNARKNKKYYNSATPPVYDLGSIQVPITLIYGKNDILADPTDVMKLKDQLPKIMDIFPGNNPYCNHLDFLWSLTVNEDINDPISKILETTDNKNWMYTGQNPNNYIDQDGLTPKIPDVAPGLDYLEENLDTVVTNNMPKCVTEKDKAVFQQEQDNLTKQLHSLFCSI